MGSEVEIGDASRRLCQGGPAPHRCHRWGEGCASAQLSWVVPGSCAWAGLVPRVRWACCCWCRRVEARWLPSRAYTYAQLVWLTVTACPVGPVALGSLLASGWLVPCVSEVPPWTAAGGRHAATTLSTEGSCRCPRKLGARRLSPTLTLPPRRWDKRVPLGLQVTVARFGPQVVGVSAVGRVFHDVHVATSLSIYGRVFIQVGGGIVPIFMRGV